MAYTTTTNSATTYVPIATYTLASSASTVTFGSGQTIPQTYTDLVLVMNFVQTTSGSPVIVFNSDTTSTYSITNLTGSGSSAASNRETNIHNYYSFDYIATSTTNPNLSIIDIMNYSNTTTYKTVLERANNASSGTGAMVGLYQNTNAIKQIDITRQSGGYWSAGSTFTLYGIKAA
jgi:hypothetical protein